MSILAPVGQDNYKREPCGQDPDKWYRGIPQSASKETIKRVIDDVKDAIRICEGCPVQALCANLGMEDENLEHGIWGGLLAGERLLMAGITPPLPNEPNRKRNTQEIRSAYTLLYMVKPWLKVVSDVS